MERRYGPMSVTVGRPFWKFTSGTSVAAARVPVDAWQALNAKTHQERSLAAQGTAVNSFGAVYPEAAGVTSMPYDLGQLAAEQYVPSKKEREANANADAEKILEAAALCHESGARTGVYVK
jgi:hypothetical protein